MIIYLFGNPFESSDSLPVKLLPLIKKEFPEIIFIHADPTENWWQGEKDIVIIDTVHGIKNVTVFDSMDAFQKQRMVTPHDYDLYTDLALMKKVGKIRSVRIVGLPVVDNQETTLSQIRSVLSEVKGQTLN